MPRRARPGDAEAIEAALENNLLAALKRLQVMFDVVDWQRVPWGVAFQGAACLLRASELRREGMAPGAALHRAADELGLERATVTSWARRWSAASRVHVARAGKGATGASLVEDEAEATPDSRAA